MTKQQLTAAALLAVFTLEAHAAEVITPQIDEPLRDGAVTRGSDGTFYLTGTRAIARFFKADEKGKGRYVFTEPQVQRLPDGSPDFLTNDGVKVWSSRDLVNWKDEGLVYDLMKISAGYNTWRARRWAHPDRPVGYPRTHGVTSPSFFNHEGRWYLIHSMAGQDVGALRSRGESIKGPYEDHLKQGRDPCLQANDRRIYERVAVGPGHGSFFRDKDGTVYMVWGPGYIAKLNEKLCDVDRQGARDLLATVAGYPNADWCAGQFAPRSASLFLDGETYLLTWSPMTDGGGAKREDSFIATSKSLFGPYSAASLLVAGSGPVRLFHAGDRGLMLSCSMDDSPVLIPLVRRNGTVAAQAFAIPKRVQPSLPGRPEMYDYAHGKPSGKWHQPNPKTGRSRLVRLFDLPLSDICIAKGGDGAWYMTGTAASRGKDGRPDFENNDGIYLWKSTDMDTWTPLGKVWDIETDAGKSPRSAWQLAYRIPANDPTCTRFARGITAPEVLFAKGTWWTAYSMNGRGTGLLRSKTGKPEGPYEDLGRLTGMGGSPSLFVAEGKEPLWLWGDLHAARLKDDLSSLAGEVVSLFLRIAPNMKDNTPGYHVMFDHWDDTAPHIFTDRDPKTKARRYHLSWSAVSQTASRASRDTYVAIAEHPLGPYGSPMMMIPHGGQTSVFAGPDDKQYASFYGADPTAVWRDRPGIVGLQLWHGRVRRTSYNYYTQRGPWDEVESFCPGSGGMIDHRVNLMPDGYVYLGKSLQATPMKFRGDGGVPMWRARDPMKSPWEFLGLLYTHKQAIKETANFPEWPDDPKQDGNHPMSWTAGMHFIHGDYHIRTYLSGVKGKKGTPVLLKSTSGRPEGPYALYSLVSTDDILVDEDGSVYATTSATGAIKKLTPDLKGDDMTWAEGIVGWAKSFLFKMRDNTEIANDCGAGLLKIGETYVTFGMNCYQAYDPMYYGAKRITGPYREFSVLPYAGMGRIFQAKDGKWYTTSQSGDAYFCAAIPGGGWVLPVHVDTTGDEIYIEYEYDFRAGVRNMSVYGQ